MLKNNFRNSKEDKQECLESILLVVIVLTVILTLYSSFHRHADGTQINDGSLLKEASYKGGIEKSSISNVVSIPGTQN